jgi:hypothetical protein
MVRFDVASGNFFTTDVGRVASYYYIHHSSVATYNNLLKPMMVPPPPITIDLGTP